MMQQGPRFTVEARGEQTVIRFTGDRVSLDALAVPDLGEELLPLVGEVEGEMMLDFAPVDFLSSLGLGMLIRLHKALQAQGSRLAVRNVAPQIYEVVEVSKLTALLDVRRREGPNRVLAADDEDCMRLLLARALRQHG
jgi:anti-anti-sigma factor